MIDNYDALTLGRFMQIDAILRNEEDEVQQQVEIIAVLADMTADEVLQLPLGDYAKYAKQTAFLRVPCKPTEITDDYRWRDLVPVADFRKINTAQYIDFQEFAKDFPRHSRRSFPCSWFPMARRTTTATTPPPSSSRCAKCPWPMPWAWPLFFSGDSAH